MPRDVRRAEHERFAEAFHRGVPPAPRPPRLYVDVTIQHGPQVTVRSTGPFSNRAKAEDALVAFSGRENVLSATIRDPNGDEALGAAVFGFAEVRAVLAAHFGGDVSELAPTLELARLVSARLTQLSEVLRREYGVESATIPWPIDCGDRVQPGRRGP